MNGQVNILGIAHTDDLDALKKVLDCRDINCMSMIPPDENLIANIVTMPFDGVAAYLPEIDGQDFAFMERLYMSRKDVTAVLIYDEIDAKAYENAMHCGITKVISSDEEPDTICTAVINEIKRSSLRRADAVARKYESKVAAVYSAKGGAGKTTTCVNIACTVSEEKRVVIADLDLQFGDVPVFLGEQKDDTMTVSALAGETGLTPNTVKAYVKTSSYSADYMQSPSRPETAVKTDPEKLKTIISMLRADYDLVIIDLPSTLDGCTLAMLDMADTVYFIVNPDAASLSDASGCLALLQGHGITRKIKTVVARDGLSFISGEDIKNTLGVIPEYFIPYDAEAAADSLNLGIPICRRNPDSKSAVAYRQMAEKEFSLKMAANTKRKLTLRGIKGKTGRAGKRTDAAETKNN